MISASAVSLKLEAGTLETLIPALDGWLPGPAPDLRRSTRCGVRYASVRPLGFASAVIATGFGH